MSLFLGKIHYWLYNKIKWFEGIEDELLLLAEKENIDVQLLKNNLDAKYGERLEDKPLEDLIDTSNIHGWLQGRINIAEGRVAMITHEIIEKSEECLTKIYEVYKSQGIKVAKEVKAEKGTINDAGEIYNSINDYILDGMPCDRVNEVISSDNDSITWKRTIDVHEQLFHSERVDVKSFYNMRDEWIKAFVTELNNEFQYVKDSETVMVIRRV